MNRIQDYALIGDCHSSALVGRDGSIDWCAFPRFDSPSVFSKILDEKKGGFYRIHAKGYSRVMRAYSTDTNILETDFHTEDGILHLQDCMPVHPLDPGRPARVEAYNSILRKATCTEGSVTVEVMIQAAFEYGSFVPRFRNTSETTAEITGGADALWVTCNFPINSNHECISATVELQEGESLIIDMQWLPSIEERPPEQHPTLEDLETRLKQTRTFWKTWLSKCKYSGPYEEPIKRSALALKAMTYAPSGAVVAAPTTSLPEQIGGERNWDYRYTWIRDSTLTLISLMILGFKSEADAFRHWLRRTSAGRPQDLQIMYGIDGRRSLPEQELSHLAGHRSSRPVRIGNGAVKQLQLDAYGSLLQAVHLYARLGGEVSPSNWHYLSGLAEIVTKRWELPDQGIWEIRDQPRHFIHSKLLCWVAMDRAIKIAESHGFEAPLDNWKTHRDNIRNYLMEDANRKGWFAQHTEGNEADASSLLVPAMGFLPPTDPLVLGTIEKIRATLENKGLVYRYRSPDGLKGEEGGFLLCSFWLLDALIHARKLKESRNLLERLIHLENDCGLYAEEAIPDTGEALGNFPQAFTHMALVTSCTHWTAALEDHLPPANQAYDFAEFAMKLMQERK
ncbi:MAG TPA: glucoamylase [Leptospiraceae bacterium]|mgnify:CR=1 FL=1|nr:glucoamylase [Spirochaetaceae bacterium]HBS05104.1 glucoamylase [Leptospiraceae bacterium]